MFDASVEYVNTMSAQAELDGASYAGGHRQGVLVSSHTLSYWHESGIELKLKLKLKLA